MELHDSRNDGEPEARASGSPVAGGVRAVEAFEDPLLIRSGYAGAGILDPEAHRALVSLERDAYPATALGVLQRVVEKVLNALFLTCSKRSRVSFRVQEIMSDCGPRRIA